MKKAFFIVVVMLVAIASLQGVTFAASVEGTVQSVDAQQSKLEIATDAGSSWVAYSATTKWPAGVTDPASLVGEKVTVATDDAGAATSVDTAAKAAAY
ncbi:MAG TPA: hypothetical protein VL688_05790 [Verrucomicrobiae bacterium]|jgi:hypothetical protein|nr:hypothetical protein [Verrucomicrobiae bacterium]